MSIYGERAVRREGERPPADLDPSDLDPSYMKHDRSAAEVSPCYAKYSLLAVRQLETVNTVLSC